MVDEIRTKEEFVDFLGSLKESLENDPSLWSNTTIESYLDALIGCVDAMEGFYINQGEKVPQNISWGVFARLLDSARLYD